MADALTGVFSRVSTNGTLTQIYTASANFTSFTVDTNGTLCYTYSTAINCHTQGGATQVPPFNGAQTVHFDPSGTLYASTVDNVYRSPNATPVPLLGTLVSGTLTVNVTLPSQTSNAAYAYDPQNRLIGVTRNGTAAESFGYDPVGNRAVDSHAGYTYNSLNQLQSGNGANYTYDVNGNRATKIDASGTTYYGYDGENRLTRITLPNGSIAEYSYDPIGRRIQKKLTDAQGIVTLRRYVYDRQNILFEMDGQDNVNSEFVHGPRIDEPLALKRNGQSFVYHTDALGSVIAITDAASNLVQRYEYDAYGRITYMQDTNFKQPYTYTGREYDEESGLYYYRARFYDASVGRFLTKDPIGFAGGNNEYAYTGGNPVTKADPFGLATVTVGVGGSFQQTAAGASQTYSVGVSTSGKVCFLATTCARIGPGESAGAGVVASAGKGDFCAGDTATLGVFGEGGDGLLGGGSVDVGSSGDVSGSVNFKGFVGGGAAAGTQVCATHTSCW